MCEDTALGIGAWQRTMATMQQPGRLRLVPRVPFDELLMAPHIKSSLSRRRHRYCGECCRRH